jgi:hypothetical protein
LAGDEKNVVLVKPYEAKNKPAENTTTQTPLNNNSNRPQTVFQSYLSLIIHFSTRNLSINCLVR